MKGFILGLCVCAALAIVGCDKLASPSSPPSESEAQYPRPEELRAELTGPDGSRHMQLLAGGEIIAETTVTVDRLGSANAVRAIYMNQPAYEPWCVVSCHVNPSTSMYVAWNPRTGTVLTSPGHAFGLLTDSDQPMLVTVNRPHFGTPPDAPSQLWINGQLADHLPTGDWRLVSSGGDTLELVGTNDQGEQTRARIDADGLHIE